MTKDSKIKAFLGYILVQILFLWLFIQFPLQPFPGIVHLKQGGEIVELEADVSFGQYLFPENIETDFVVDRVSIEPLGWVLVVLILFVMPILIGFRIGVFFHKKEKEKN